MGDEHYESSEENVELLVQFINNSNIVASFLALLKILPPIPSLRGNARGHPEQNYKEAKQKTSSRYRRDFRDDDLQHKSEKASEEPVSAIPENVNILLHDQYEVATRRSQRLQSQQAIEHVSRMARFPFPVKPGDYFVTRPPSSNWKKPTPRCREMIAWELETRTEQEKLPKDQFIAVLPHNHRFGPVISVFVHRAHGTWMLMVLFSS